MRVERITDEATLGLDAAFMRSVRRNIDEQIREPAERLYGSGASRDAVREDLKAIEQLVVYHDYEACCVSVLGRLAAEGQTWAWPLIERIVDNTRRCLTEHVGEGGSFFPIRRLPLHLARCHRFLGLAGGGRRDRLLREAIEAAAGAVIEHFGQFHPGLSELCNQTLGTGVNHVAIAAEGVWLAGEVLNRREWQRLAEDFADRLLAFGHRDGYFEENTNDRREGGPSLCYTTLTAGALYHLCRWRGDMPTERLEDCGRFSRMMTDAGLSDLLFADERTNRQMVGAFGLALHSLSEPGRGFLRLLLADRVRPIGTRLLEAMARLDHELDGVELGGGAVPEPWIDGSFRLSLPLGVHRGDGWTLGLSALRALNRDIQPDSDYALDRQALVYASHHDAGVLVAGFKSKRDTRFSTLCAGDDAYPASTGELVMTSDAMMARVRYESFEATLCWQFGTEPTLVMTSEHDGTLMARLPLELLHGQRLIVDGDRSTVLGDDELEITDVRRVDAEAWSVACSHAGGLRWPISPFNPYTKGNVSPRESWRPVWAVPWRGRCEFRFAARGCGWVFDGGRLMRWALVIVLGVMTLAWTGSTVGSVARGSEVVAQREAKRSEMMEQYKRRWSAIESAIEAMRAEKNALYVRHKADVDVRAWAIGECMAKLAAAEQAEQQELSQRIDAALTEAKQMVDALAEGRDYFGQKRGSLLRAIVVDGQEHPEPYAVHVPTTYDAGRSWPLFVYLHGGGGSVDQARYALDRVYAAARAEGETSEPPALATGHYIKIWLPRRGEHWAEAANEDSVFAAIDDMEANYNIDADRVYVQGFSMGGFASMHFAVRYPGELAGSGPSGMPNVGAFLPFVENVANLPIYLCHGSRDDTCQPANSLMLFDRLRARSYDAMLVMDAQLGHGTPAETRAGQEFWLLGKRRDRCPRRVVYVTDDLRYHRAYWVDILALSSVVKPLRAKMPDDFGGDPPRIGSVEATRYTINKQAVLEPVPNQRVARIEAACIKPGEFEVKTEYIESFVILSSAELARPGEVVTVSVDGQPALTLPWPGDGRLVFVKGTDGTWGR